LGGFITSNCESGSGANPKPVKGVVATPGTEWLQRGLIARVRYPKKQCATPRLQDVGEM
jgi:hypothetical protein